jgi:LPXTG-motif cell wall-anchored protein
MKRLLLLTTLSMVLALMLAPAAFGQEEVPFPEGTPPPAGGECPAGTQPTVNGCVSDEALADYFRAIGEGQPGTATPTPTTTPTSTVTPTSTATNAAAAQYEGGKEVVLPETGGASGIALLAGALLVGGGVMSFALFRRS